MRRFLREFHVFSGLLAGLVVALIGVSGSILVFRADIERFMSREWRYVDQVGAHFLLDQAISAGAAAIPAKEVVRVVLPRQRGEAVEVILQKRRPRNLADAELVGVFVDPYQGVVIGQRPRSQGWLWQMQDFHYALFAGENGLKANGVSAVFLLLLAISGPFLWWPGWSRRNAAFRIRPKPASARWRDLHALTGVIACFALAFISLTGIYFAYRSTATAVVSLATGGGMTAPKALSDAALAPATFASLVTVAENSEPTARIEEIRPARFETAPVVVSFTLPGEQTFGQNKIYLDPRTATVLRKDIHATLPLGSRVLANMGPWHFGSWGGRLTQWIWFAAGLIPAFLFGTGLWLWLHRRKTASSLPLASAS